MEEVPPRSKEFFGSCVHGIGAYNPPTARGDLKDTEPPTAWYCHAGIREQDDGVLSHASHSFSKEEATASPTHTLTRSHRHPAALHTGPRACQSRPSNISRGPLPPRIIVTICAGISSLWGIRAPPTISAITQDFSRIHQIHDHNPNPKCIQNCQHRSRKTRDALPNGKERYRMILSSNQIACESPLGRLMPGWLPVGSAPQNT